MQGNGREVIHRVPPIPAPSHPVHPLEDNLAKVFVLAEPLLPCLSHFDTVCEPCTFTFQFKPFDIFWTKHFLSSKPLCRSVGQLGVLSDMDSSMGALMGRVRKGALWLDLDRNCDHTEDYMHVNQQRAPVSDEPVWRHVLKPLQCHSST